MPTELYSHNKRAYENAVSLLETRKKAAVIHPTGTGKSFIAFKLCEDNPDKKICWLSPSEYIFATQLENLKKASNGYAPENISFFTYAKLMNMDKAEISEIKPDYIILDEFHRCGAEMWGQGVDRLLSEYPETPVLGLSATAIRYLDNQRNMADELFDGNIASEMALGEAIVLGILAPPKYVLSAFSCEKDLERYKKRVMRAKSRAVRDEGEKYLDALKRALEKADGLDVIFDKHMTERTGKYIVFCANYEHMCRMRELSGEWFGKVDKTPHIYSMYSEDPSSDKEFKSFKDDSDDTHLRLLYCIDALNEGVHVDGISGVILLRPTVSPIIYKQQIGRALQTGIKQSSVIFDIVLNIENLYSIGSVEEEMQIATSYYRSLGLDDEIVNEHFKIIDEVHDCLELFDRLGETLSASWNLMYEKAKEYYAENGNLEVPKRYVTPGGYTLGAWIRTQRLVYAGKTYGILTDGQIKKLEKIGMRWENIRDMAWQKYFDAAKAYREENGDLNIPAAYVTKDNIKLGMWIMNLRTAKKNGFNKRYLTDERISALDSIGMIWEVADYMWQRYYGACLTYYGLNGNLDIPVNYVTNDGIRLGCWLNNIRTKYKNGGGCFSKEQISALEDLGVVWDSRYEGEWNKFCEAAKAYYKTHGNLNVPATYKTPDGILLGKWIDRQRRNTKISETRKAKLDCIGMIWQKEDSWEIRFKLAKQYFDENGNIDMSTNYVTDGIWLGKWISEQKKKYKSGKLSAEQVRRLETLGIDWDADIQSKIWEEHLERIRAISDRNGVEPCLLGNTSEETQKLNAWLRVQRKNYKEGKLSADRISKLQSAGIVLDSFNDAWETGFAYAKSYYETKGNLNVPANYVDKTGYALGSWISRNRSSAKSRKMTETQKKRLDGIGMVWDPEDERWESMYKSAEVYFSEHGNLDVPTVYKTPDGHSLKEWLRTQRESRLSGKLSPERMERLNKIGIDWLSPTARCWETYFSACEKHYKTYGNLEMGAAYIDENGLHIGRWLQKQRNNKKKLKTDGENGNQVKRLESIGIVWKEQNSSGISGVADCNATLKDRLSSYAI